MIGAATGGAIVGAAVEPNGRPFWVYLAAAAAITAHWARSRTALGAGLTAVGLLGILGGTVWSAFASVIPFVVATATAVRASAGLQVVHVLAIAVGSFAALLAPTAMGADSTTSMVVWSVITGALVAGSHRLSRPRALG